MTTKEMKEELAVHSTLLEVPVAATEIMDSWILFTYDIPTTKEGNRVRYEWLKEARQVGAVAHTESVWYMPWTSDANIAAIRIAKTGKLFIWYTTISDPERARELTRHYDQEVLTWLDDLDARLERIESHLLVGKLKLAGHMIERTICTMSELREVIRRRGSPTLADQLARVYHRLIQMMAQA